SSHEPPCLQKSHRAVPRDTRRTARPAPPGCARQQLERPLGDEIEQVAAVAVPGPIKVLAPNPGPLLPIHQAHYFGLAQLLLLLQVIQLTLRPAHAPSQDAQLTLRTSPFGLRTSRSDVPGPADPAVADHGAHFVFIH